MALRDPSAPAALRSRRRVLGIDPGSRVTGFGVLEGPQDRIHTVATGTIRLNEEEPLATRLSTLHARLMAIISDHAPTEVAIERVFVSRNADSALKLGHARGVCLLAVSQAGLPLFEYAPAMVKKAVTGRGRADKHQMTALMTLMLGLPHEPSQDAADALAIALCHLLLAEERALFEAASERPAGHAR